MNRLNGNRTPIAWSRDEQKQAASGAPVEFADVQKGSPLVWLLMIGSAVAITGSAILPNLVWSIAVIAQSVAAVCFCTLSIRITNTQLLWQFGPGWIRGKVVLSEIESVKVSRTRFAYGWGFERTKRGWRFNPNGALTIFIRGKNGTRLQLGISRAYELQDFLASRHARV